MTNPDIKWVAIAPGIWELSGTKIQIKYKASLYSPLHIAYDGVKISQWMFDDLEDAQRVVEANLTEFMRMFDSKRKDTKMSQKLIELPTGDWINPHNVYGIRLLSEGPLGPRVGIDVSLGGSHLIKFANVLAARSWISNFAKECNRAINLD